MTIPCQRWTERRARYRPAGERIQPAEYDVDVLDEGPARRFVEAHHYSGSYPAARCRVGLFRRAQLVGVAVFSVPAGPAVVGKWLPHVGGALAGVELGRLVLLDDVPGNGESWFLARAFRELRRELPDVRGVVSFSDPYPRRTQAGAEVMPGHVGVVYQALNGRHIGRTNRATLYLDRAGRVVSPRALSKLRTDDQGAAYAYRALLEAGAPARRPLEGGPEYVRRALTEGPFRRVRHPGCLAYSWPVGGRDVANSHRASLPALPYPRKETFIADPAPRTARD